MLNVARCFAGPLDGLLLYGGDRPMPQYYFAWLHRTAEGLGYWSHSSKPGDLALKQTLKGALYLLSEKGYVFESWCKKEKNQGAKA